ncbi:MAG TPA: CRTAC1 family protein [Anaerolineae bacterium]
MLHHRKILRSVLSIMLLLSVASVAVASSGGVTFQDIAAGGGAGITYHRVESPSDALFDALKQQPVYTFNDLAITPFTPRGAPGVALLDFDRDDDLDIYVTNGPGANNSLYSNQLKETGQVTFVDVAAAAGVGALDQDSTGVCFGDIDNDGDEDLYVLGNNEPNRLFENQGNDTFTDITLPSGTGGGQRTSSSCAMGDANGDGLLDIVVANTYNNWNHLLPYFGMPFVLNEHNQLFLNSGGNVFVDASAASGLESLAGLPPEFAGAAGITWAIAMVDYDLDGDVDVIAADDETLLFVGGDQHHGFIRIFQNDGTGHFTDVTFAANMNRVGQWTGLSFGDVNCDGHMDIFGSNAGDYGLTPLAPLFQYQLGTLTSRWFLGQPDGTFTDPGVGALIAMPFGWGTSMTDYDNDGDTDIIYYGGSDAGPYVEASNPGAILQNQNCSATFRRDAAALAGSANHTRRTVQGLAVGDVNNDGFVDIVSVSNFDKPEPIPLVPFPVAYGSPFDADARYVPTFLPTEIPGVFVWSGIEFPDGSLAVEANSGDNDNNWVTVNVLGTAGVTSGGRVNRDGIGAVVKFTPKHGATVIQPILGGSSHASQDSLTANFGLGNAKKGTVEVLWPGGVRNRLYDVHKFERVVFPEIPCSFDGDWARPRDYVSCVRTSLDELVEAGVLNRVERARFFVSALLAFYDH